MITAVASGIDPSRLISHIVVLIGLVLLLVKRIFDSDGGGRSTGGSGGMSGERPSDHLSVTLLPVQEAVALRGEVDGPARSMTEITEMPVRSRSAAWEPVSAWLLTFGRLVLGGVWIAAGIAKVTDLDASVRAVRAYRLLPEIAAQITGAGLPLVEILLGVLLVVGTGIRATAVVSSILMVAFVVGIASAWARGLRIDCGCFGSGGQLATGADPTYPWELARDGGLLLISLLLGIRPRCRIALDGLLMIRKETV